MPTELVVKVPDQPGVLADVGEAFGELGINIRAAAAFTQNGKGYLHFVVDDADLAQKVLGELGLRGLKILEAREVLLVSLDDTPGELGRFTRKLASAGVNISSFYTAGSSAGETEVILAVDDIEAATEV